MDGMGILKFVSVRVVRQIREVMERNHVGADDVALFVFHQASNLALDSLTRLLRLPPEKVYRNLARVGNTVSASIPIALEDARREGRVGPGDKVLLSGFGVGLSWATALVQL
jgi:3-oxoacyl-[acyl-carrier-protein] synthase-3